MDTTTIFQTLALTIGSVIVHGLPPVLGVSAGMVGLGTSIRYVKKLVSGRGNNYKRTFGKNYGFDDTMAQLDTVTIFPNGK